MLGRGGTLIYSNQIEKFYKIIDFNFPFQIRERILHHNNFHPATKIIVDIQKIGI